MIDGLAEQLAAFCFEHLEGGVNASTTQSNSSEEVEVNAESDIFDNGLMVRDKHCCIVTTRWQPH